MMAQDITLNKSAQHCKFPYKSTHDSYSNVEPGTQLACTDPIKSRESPMKF